MVGTLTSSLLLLLAAPGSYPASTASSPLDVPLRTGTFRGVSTTAGIEKWLGLPFALPPTGSLRFKAPVPVTSTSKAVKDASKFGNACPQPAGNLGAPIGEDCLVLNVPPLKLCLPFTTLNAPIRSSGPRAPLQKINCPFCFGYMYALLNLYTMSTLQHLTILLPAGRGIHLWVDK